MYVQLFLLLYIFIIADYWRKVNNNRLPFFAVLYHIAQTQSKRPSGALPEGRLICMQMYGYS